MGGDGSPKKVTLPMHPGPRANQDLDSQHIRDNEQILAEGHMLEVAQGNLEAPGGPSSAVIAKWHRLAQAEVKAEGQWIRCGARARPIVKRVMRRLSEEFCAEAVGWAGNFLGYQDPMLRHMQSEEALYAHMHPVMLRRHEHVRAKGAATAHWIVNVRDAG